MPNIKHLFKINKAIYMNKKGNLVVLMICNNMRIHFVQICLNIFKLHLPITSDRTKFFLQLGRL